MTDGAAVGAEMIGRRAGRLRVVEVPVRMVPRRRRSKVALGRGTVHAVTAMRRSLGLLRERRWGRPPGEGPRRALVVIAKEPVPGAVKTRLAPTVGADGAARAAAAMLTDTLAAMTQVEAKPWVCFAPPDARRRIARLAPGFGLLAQVQGDLGDRLAGCFAALLGGGAERVVIVAADTPHVPRATYQAAFALLDHVDVVLGPAQDGGYYLVGAKLALPELFVGVPMGTRWCCR